MSKISCYTLARHGIYGLFFYVFAFSANAAQANMVHYQTGVTRNGPMTMEEYQNPTLMSWQRQLDLFEQITDHDKPHHDNLLDWFWENHAILIPPYFFEMADSLRRKGHIEASLQWFVIAELRTHLDTIKCADSTASATQITYKYQHLIDYAKQDLPAYNKALEDTLQNESVMVYSTRPEWVCIMGMQAYLDAIKQLEQKDAARAAQGQDVPKREGVVWIMMDQYEPELKPEQDWPDLLTQTRARFAKRMETFEDVIKHLEALERGAP